MPEPPTHGKYAKAHEAMDAWWRDRQPLDPSVCQVALEYARERYGEVNKTFQDLDEKAYQIIRLASGGGILAGVVGHAWAEAPEWWLIVAALLLALSLIFAILAVVPKFVATPMPMMDFQEWLEREPERAIGKLPAAYATAIEKTEVTIAAKETALRVSLGFLGAAVGVLAIGLLF